MDNNGNYGVPGNNVNSNNINISQGLYTATPAVAPAQTPHPRIFIPPADPEYQQRSKTVYNILALVLGFTGIHEFYFGYKTAGAWMLGLCIISAGCLSPILWLFAIASIFITTAPKGYYKYGNLFLPLGTEPSEEAIESQRMGVSPITPSRQTYYLYAGSALIGLIIVTAIISVEVFILSKPDLTYKPAYVAKETDSNADAESLGKSKVEMQLVEESVSGLSWEQVCELSDSDTDLTDFQIQSRRKEYIGQRVKWSGKVIEAKSGFLSGTTIITIRVGSAKNYLTRKEIECKLVNHENENKKATRYKKNDDITIIGTIESIDAIGKDVILKDAVIAE